MSSKQWRVPRYFFLVLWAATRLRPERNLRSHSSRAGTGQRSSPRGEPITRLYKRSMRCSMSGTSGPPETGTSTACRAGSNDLGPEGHGGTGRAHSPPPPCPEFPRSRHKVKRGSTPPVYLPPLAADWQSPIRFFCRRNGAGLCGDATRRGISGRRCADAHRASRSPKAARGPHLLASIGRRSHALENNRLNGG